MIPTPDLYETVVARLNATVAQLSTALEAVTRLCMLRQSGFCLISCPGQVLCAHDDLIVLPWRELPEKIKEVVQP